MRVDKVEIAHFKNLKDFSIDFNEEKMETVLLGQNATGKSNFLEALVLIFKYLDLRKPPPFEYRILYNCYKKNIVAAFFNKQYHFSEYDSKRWEDGKWELYFLNSEITQNDFFLNKQNYLPKYVFTYYSGISNRLKDHFDDHQKQFYDKIIRKETKSGEIDDLRKLFYVQLIHSYFVLMAYYSYPNDEKESVKFLKNVLKINDLESILFILKRPAWSRSKKGADKDRFWGAAGLVRKFLDRLWDFTIAPIYNDEQVKIDFRRSETQRRLYLYISDKDKLQQLAKYYEGNTDFFKALESTYISDMIEEVRVKVQKVNLKGKVTFKELSEGEQQLLTVLGLLKFTKDEESLILLDEPDTHLNPLWKWKYLDYLNKVVHRAYSTQIIINTHDPLIIGSLTKEQVRIFQAAEKDGKISVIEPDIDPKGLGVEGILTSELFGMPTTLDTPTLKLLDERNKLLVKLKEGKISPEENSRMRDLFDQLNKLGFTETYRDPLYQKFVTAISQRPEFNKKDKLTEEDIEKQNEIALSILKEISIEEK